MTKFRLAAAGALAAALVFGQGQGMRGNGGTPPDPATMIQHRVDRLGTVLGLSDAQKASAVKIFTDAQTATTAATANNQTNRDALAAAVRKNDVVAIDQIAATLGATSGKVMAIQGKADAAFYALLTPDQQTKYDSMPHGGPGMGPGGMMMGPGGMRNGAGGMGRTRPNQEQ
jgi:Spy/CpxP family protein refolding chaperone